ncbi:hypothetical protein PSPO01_15242 [Paraphaeosphaeria sporulosa]
MKTAEDAFQRHPRPQLPTKATLQLETWKLGKALVQQPEDGRRIRVQNEDPWEDTTCLGNLLQGNDELSICVYKMKVGMMKKLTLETGRQYLEKVQAIDRTHTNILTIREVFETGKNLYLLFGYHRCTLEEVLHVHLTLSPAAIRVCSTTGRVMLAHFEECVWQTTERTANIDLQQLGLTIVECMEGTASQRLRNIEYIRMQRKANRMFGLENGERWSGCKLLVDFLDDLFNEEKQAVAKFERPHGFLVEREPEDRVMLPFTELVPLECFTRWRPARHAEKDAICGT